MDYFEDITRPSMPSLMLCTEMKTYVLATHDGYMFILLLCLMCTQPTNVSHKPTTSYVAMPLTSRTLSYSLYS